MARVGELKVPVSAGRETRLESIDFYDAVREQVDLFRTTADKKQVKIDTAGLPKDNAFVVCERSELASAIAALLHNAIKYSYKHRTVFVRGRIELDVARVEFSNYGDGIPPEMLDKITERHTRADVQTRRRVRPGSGLGLPIAIHFFEDLLQGKVDITSTRHGSTR